MAQSVPAVKELDELVAWMRANGVLECSHAGTTLRLAAVGETSPPGLHDVGEEPEFLSRPPSPDGCSVCGEPRGQSIYRERGLCRQCGFKEQIGAN